MMRRTESAETLRRIRERRYVAALEAELREARLYLRVEAGDETAAPPGYRFRRDCWPGWSTPDDVVITRHADDWWEGSVSHEGGGYTSVGDYHLLGVMRRCETARGNRTCPRTWPGWVR